MARSQEFIFWTDVYGASPNIMMDRYTYHAVDDTVTMETVNIGTGGSGSYHPPVGSQIAYECGVDAEDGDLIEYYGRGNNTGVDVVVTEGAAFCCDLEASEFSVVKTNNTDLLTPNGTIVVTSPTLDISLYEASINDGASYVTQVDNAITFENLPAGNYTVIIKIIGGACNVTASLTIVDNITYPPPIIEETTVPALYSPVFHPITVGFKLVNNQATVKQDGGGTYLEVDSQDEKDYLATLPIIKIFDNEDYAGTYQITGVDDVDDPEKFYFVKTFTTEQAVLFVPFDRQVFQLFAERDFNDYQKIADMTVYPQPDTGEYLLRVEGFLQAVFEVNKPLNNGEEITLLRNYYVLPLGFDMEDSPTILKAVYAAVPDLTSFLAPFIPLGPAPINFISQLTAKGLPVLFSYIDTDIGRIVNVTSSNQTDILASTPTVLIFGLPLNVYNLNWINPAGAIADLQVSPALPAWISILPSASDTVQLSIDTGLNTEGGDYDPDDYDEEDYLISGVNLIVGCYEFEFSDGVTPLFTLRICIFPIQSSTEVCESETNFNIAWINREGGWSSYIFEGRKSYGVDIGKVTTYKKSRELKRASVEDVYHTVEVALFNKSIQEMDFITSLRYSIQAFLWSDLTQQWSIPIILDKGGFNTYTRPFKQIELEEQFTFKYAEEVVIQSQ